MTDTPQLLLAYHLTALKLPTFLREYDKLARQWAAEGVDHPRYLLRLAELELIERERRMVERRIKEARFPATKSPAIAQQGPGAGAGPLRIHHPPREHHRAWQQRHRRDPSRAWARPGGLPEGAIGRL